MDRQEENKKARAVGKWLGIEKGIKECKMKEQQRRFTEGGKTGRDSSFKEVKRIGRVEDMGVGRSYSHEQDITLEEMDQWLEDMNKPSPVTKANGATTSPEPDPFKFIFE